ncbi:ATP-binding cassette domain-containing protein [Alkaliphilus hydrothermalis]|uniref:Tungstate transport system ATP-binding protein n=1 Tax=Alkaliphilus hydrothermalis TaxID=1482730 RepID=A0ABS2NSF3_9FIRM|nr:ATP-binding cassette domain-containing protein [Alkaliphilus hydrothermalis]MBM7615865.1 tungstate transport system ATP-binding protein [Alkaliphilus hydrothermalis]
MELRIKDLTKLYDDKLILDIEDFYLPEKTFLGIIGPNGAGKSTLAKIVANIEDASTGEVLYNGSSFTAELSKDMTLVFQKPYLLLTTVYHNISYPLQLRKVAKEEIHRRVMEIMEEMEILHLKDQKAWTLSGGEAQKVALARGLILKPSLLVLDEFTANIDPASMLILEKSIQNYHAKYSPTIIMVTHNLQQVQRLCSHLAYMNKGEIVESGEVDEIILNSQNPITQKFISGEIVV